MNQITTKYENKLYNSSAELYLLKQKVSLSGLFTQSVEYFETIGICTKLSDAIRIKEKNKGTCLFTIIK